MDRNDELYKAGLLLHGHKCPPCRWGCVPDSPRWRPSACRARPTAS